MAKLTKLTVEQEALIPVVRDEWLAHGLSTEPADRANAVEGVKRAYEAARLPAPRIVVWLDSPLGGAIGTTMLGQVGDQVWDQVWDQVGDQVGDQVWDQVWGQVRGQVWDQVRGQVWDQVGDQVGGQVRGQVWDQVRGQVGDQVWGQVWDQVWGQVRGQVWDQVGGQVGDQVWDQVWDQVGDQVWDQVWDQVGLSLWGQHDAGYLSFYDYFARVGLAEIVAPMFGMQRVAKSSGWWWAMRGAVVLTDRPCALHRNPLHQLHHDKGPAIAYRDGWAIYAWKGMRVPEWVIASPTPEAIASEKNVEFRRCAIESFGWDRFITAAELAPVGPAEPDPGNPGQSIRLYDVPERLWGDHVRLLVGTNGSVERDGTRRVYGLTVPPEFGVPSDAAGWSYGLSGQEYRELVRRT